MAAEAGAADEKKSAEQFPIPGAQFVKQLVLPGNVSTTSMSFTHPSTDFFDKPLWRQALTIFFANRLLSQLHPINDHSRWRKVPLGLLQ